MILIPLILLTGLTLWLAWYMIRHDRGEKEPLGALWAAFGYGFLGAIAAVSFELFIPSQYLSAEHPAPFGLGLFAAAMAIGVIEEVCKFTPAALYLYKKRYFNEHNDGIIYFAIAGLGFGLPENIIYVLEYGTATGFMRAILTPFFHAAMTGLVGYYLIRVKIDRKPWWHVAVALAAAAGLHGMYDFGLMSRKPLLAVVSLMITFGATIALFVLYHRATATDMAVGLSVVGKNSFCRSCGFANPQHKLYCQRCGKHA